MNQNVVKLPDDFIGKEDEVKLESFGAHLMEHGVVSRWNWRRLNGIDVAFLLYQGAPHARLMACIGRDRRRDLFYADDAQGRRLREGTLEAVMASVDAYARSPHPAYP